jgi:hypothetical protein
MKLVAASLLALDVISDGAPHPEQVAGSSTVIFDHGSPPEFEIGYLTGSEGLLNVETGFTGAAGFEETLSSPPPQAWIGSGSPPKSCDQGSSDLTT